MYNPIHDELKNRKSSRKGMYLRYTSSKWVNEDTKGEAVECKDANGNERRVCTRKESQRARKEHVSPREGQTKLGPEAWCRTGGR